jgi:hypothetical protein
MRRRNFRLANNLFAGEAQMRVRVTDVQQQQHQLAFE